MLVVNENNQILCSSRQAFFSLNPNYFPYEKKNYLCF